MIIEDKVTELFCMADDFCKFFDVVMEKYTLKPKSVIRISLCRTAKRNPLIFPI